MNRIKKIVLPMLIVITLLLVIPINIISIDAFSIPVLDAFSIPVLAEEGEGDDDAPIEHTVTNIIVGQSFNREGQPETVEVTITGSLIDEVMILPRGTGQPVVLEDQYPGSHYVFYGTLELEQGIGNLIYINGVPYQIEIGTMPEIGEVLTRRVVRNDDTEKGTFKMLGSNFQEIKNGNVSAEYGRELSYAAFPDEFFDEDNPTFCSGNNLSASAGLKNILFTKKTTTSINGKDINVEIRYEYKNQFHLIEEREIENLEMFPNRGEKGDQVYFTGENLPESSVFFLREIDGSSPFTESNKAKHVSYKDGVLVVEVPQFEGKRNF